MPPATSAHGRQAIAGLVAGTLVLGACARNETPAPAVATVRIVTGPPGLAFRPLGEALAAAYRRALPDVRFEVVNTPGTVTNLQRLQSGGAELAFAVSNTAYAAYNGLDANFRTAAANLRGIAVLHPSSVHILVPSMSTARTVADLDGVVAIGTEGSQVTAKLILDKLGQAGRVHGDQSTPLTDAPEALADGTINAAIVVAAAPVDLVHDAAAKGARLLPVSGRDVQRLRADYPFLRPGEIPADVYPGAQRPVATMLVDVLLMTRAGLDDELVRRLTSALFDVLPDLATRFEYLRLINGQRAPATPIPLHPGAALFYRERELQR